MIYDKHLMTVCFPQPCRLQHYLTRFTSVHVVKCKQFDSYVSLFLFSICNTNIRNVNTLHSADTSRP